MITESILKDFNDNWERVFNPDYDPEFEATLDFLARDRDADENPKAYGADR